MKNLVKIFLGGFVAFMTISIVQEWELFYSSWFGETTSSPPEISQVDRRAAQEAVRLALTLMGHFYASGGDPRFAERLPAADGIIQEMRADIDYLARNQRRQDPQLRQMEVVATTQLAEDRLELRTRELWQVHSIWMDSGTEADPVRVQVLYSRYLVVRGPQGWRVEGWEFDEPEPAAQEAGD